MMQLRKATRKQVKLKIGLQGPSGSGKTYSALLVAFGMTGDWSKIAVIDAENDSASLYSHLGDFNVLSLEPPFSPERYIEAIRACNIPEIEVIIIDSMSHEWDGKGGVLEIIDSMTGNSFTNWGKVTPRHNRFIDAILHTKKHFICTIRSKQDYVLSQNSKGKQVPEKVGLKAITREGVDYEFTLVFDVDIKHNAVASKDRTMLFMDQPQAVLSADHGKKLMEWAESGEKVTTPDAATDAQVEEIEELIKSKVFTDEERSDAAQKLADGITGAKAVKWIAYFKETIQSREQATKKDAQPEDQPEAEQPAPDPKQATVRQKTELLLLLNNKVITSEEKNKMLESLNSMDSERIEKAIAKIKKSIDDRTGIKQTQTEPAA